MPILFKGRQGRQEIESVRDYLCSQPADLYTTMRLSGRTGKVFEFEMHLMRLKATPSERELIEKMLQDVCTEKYRDQAQDQDLRITLIRRQTTIFFDSFDLIFEEMKTSMIEMESCQVEIRLGHRSNVQEKNSQWVKDRRELERLKLPESNEIILSDESGRLYEGLSSNFFILRQDDKIQTAPLSDVLPGTVMKRILQKYNEKFQVVFEHPKINEIDTWKGAFITSTSRLILPIEKIIINDFIKTVPLNQKISEMREDLKREVLSVL